MIEIQRKFSLPFLLNNILMVETRWWYARDVRTGREGVVPAAYLY